MPKVQFSGAVRSAVNDAASIQIEADSIRELLRKLGERYPAMQSHIDDGVAVSINGQIYRDQLNTPLPPDAEVFIMPRVPGG